VGQSAVCDAHVALFVILASAFNEGRLVVPPHDVSPVGIGIFLEFTVEFEVLSDLHDDVVWADSWILSGFSLIPFASSVMERAHRAGHIDDGSLLSALVLLLDTCKLSILVARHQVKTTL
jgi:hypothetical protein